jgi:PKHD-type hydroxylase
MKDYLIIENCLTKDDLGEIYYYIDQFGDWIDGNITYSGKEGVKKNDQIAFSDEFVKQKISDIVYDRMDTHGSFHEYTIPTNSARPIISRTNTGGYYRPHHDKADNGDFSTTIFLNDDFEGGELCLWVNEEEKRIKLPAGGSVTYRTGIPHMVREVTDGHRDAVVFWTHSRLKDLWDIEIYHGLSQALKYIKMEDVANLEEASENPAFILNSLKESILRKSYRKL